MIKEEMETRDDSGFTLRSKDPSKETDMQKLGDNMSDGIEELYTVRDLIDIKEKLDSTEKIKMHDNQELITRSPVKDRQVKSEVDVKNIIGGRSRRSGIQTVNYNENKLSTNVWEKAKMDDSGVSTNAPKCKDYYAPWNVYALSADKRKELVRDNKSIMRMSKLVVRKNGGKQHHVVAYRMSVKRALGNLNLEMREAAAAAIV